MLRFTVAALIALTLAAPAAADERDVRVRSGTTTAVATLVRGAGPAPHAGILWVHWLGDPPTTNRTEFLSDARALALRGATSLLVDAPWAKPDWFERGRRPETDARDIAAETAALRRALDLLAAQPGIDRHRIAYVGHDFGAMAGVLLTAADRRVRWAVYLTPTLSFWEWYLLGRQPADAAAYIRTMSAFDLPPYLARSQAAGTLVQTARHDAYVSSATAAAFRNALPARDRTLKAYDTDHAMVSPAATADRLAWLAQRLGLRAEEPRPPENSTPTP